MDNAGDKIRDVPKLGRFHCGRWNAPVEMYGSANSSLFFSFDNLANFVDGEWLFPNGTGRMHAYKMHARTLDPRTPPKTR